MLFIISEGRGTGANALKIGSKRRRTKAEMAEAREEERLRQEGVDRQAQEIAGLQERMREMEQEKRRGDAAAEILSRMIRAGRAVQNPDGTITLLEQSDVQSQIDSNV